MKIKFSQNGHLIASIYHVDNIFHKFYYKMSVSSRPLRPPLALAK
jgi:hypothetical protein